jgi:AcrR family transcriptional regulator
MNGAKRKKPEHKLARAGARKGAAIRSRAAPAKSGGSAEGRMRSMPQQERARVAVERILSATGELLDEAGFESLTTTAIAARAEVNIATLYRYFPDKFKVVHEFAVRRDREWAETLQPLLEQFAVAPDWRRALKSIVDQSVKMRVAHAGGRSLSRALQSSPELWAVDRELHSRARSLLAEAIRRRKPRMAKPQVEVVAAVAITAYGALLDDAVADFAEPRKAVGETLLMLETYLGNYLD